MSPNKPLSEEKKDRIHVLLKRYSIGKTAKELGVSRPTVRKYADKEG